MELLLIRHGLPERLDAGDGPADPALVATGHRQAAQLAAGLRHEQIDAIYSSPLRRARETAAPLAAMTNLEPRIDDALVEWDRGTDSYITMEELKATDHHIWRAMADGRWHDLGIDPAAFRSRVVTAIDAMAADHRGDRVAVVCHGGVINTYVAAVLGLEAMLFFEPDYTSVTRVLVASGGTRSLRALNETAHLRPFAPRAAPAAG